MKLFGKEVLPMKTKIQDKYIGNKEEHRHYDFFLQVMANKKEIATIHFQHRYFPVEYFYIKYIEVSKKHRGKSSEKVAGVGGSILRHIEAFLGKRVRAGKCCLAVLVDAVADMYDENNAEEVYEMYKQHGWKRLVDGDTVLYRSPQKVSSKVLSQIDNNFYY